MRWTYEEGHGERVEDQDEEEFEKMRGIPARPAIQYVLKSRVGHVSGEREP